ncbi:hypothetical protein C0991_007858 [Blastosporella zonata]|nr:hypothetical protein C0991_007858 [Blastosporella zonata]
MAALSQPNRVSATGSPRGRHSVQQGTAQTFTAPAVPGEQYVPPPPTALHTTDGDAFNVDPNVPYLDSGTQQIPGAKSSRSGSRRFSRITSLARRALRQQRTVDGAQHHPEEGRPLTTARRPSLPAVSPVTSSSNTVHETVEDYEGTTAISHDALPIAQVMGSPVYIEPQLTNDYAKMDSPHVSIASFGSYMSRVRQFFHDLNELPWVAERVTVDYVPGEKKGRRQARERRLQRPISWYGNTPHSRAVQMFSDTTSPSSQSEILASQSQLPAQYPTPYPADLSRSLPPQEPVPVEEDPRAPTPPPEVTFEYIDPAHPSNAPFVAVVPADWSLHEPEYVPPTPPPLAPPPPPPGPRPPPGPKLGTNPLPDATPAPQSLNLFPPPGTVGLDGYQQFVPTGETFPTGFVRYSDVDRQTALFANTGFHPQPRDPGPQDPAVLSPWGITTTPLVTQWPDLEPAPMPMNAHTPAQGPAAVVPPPTSPSPNFVVSRAPLAVPRPRMGSTSNAPISQMGLGSAAPTPHVQLVSFASPRPASVAPSRASHTNYAPSQARGMGQTQTRPPSTAPSHASHTTTATPVTYSQSASAAPLGYSSRAPSAAPPMSQSLSQGRPPSAAPNHASRATSATLKFKTQMETI